MTHIKHIMSYIIDQLAWVAFSKSDCTYKLHISDDVSHTLQTTQFKNMKNISGFRTNMHDLPPNHLLLIKYLINNLLLLNNCRNYEL